MSSENFADYVAIPEILHSVFEGGPFSKCVVCTKALLEEGVNYSIEKVFRGSEVIVEYAICQECGEDLASELSEESMERVQQFMMEKIDWASRGELLETTGEDVGPWIDTCLVTGKSRGDLDAYSICGRGRGVKLERSLIPFMVSGAVAEEVAELLSKATKERLDGFVDEHFGLPSELRDVFDSSPLLLV